MDNTLLLIVDMQNGFVSEKTDYVVPKVIQLISSNKFSKIAFTQYFNTDSSPFERYLNWFKLKTREEQSLVNELVPYAHFVVRKNGYTSINAEMKSYLANNNITTVFIAGIDTDCCVLTSAVDLFQMGIRPVVLADYCASNGGAESHTAALRVLVRLIGDKQIHLGTL